MPWFLNQLQICYRPTEKKSSPEENVEIMPPPFFKFLLILGEATVG